MLCELPADVVQAEGVGKYYPNPSPRRILQYLAPMPITYRNGDTWALRNVSFNVQRGQVVGVVGQNGSGKSTLMQMVAGLMTPSEGRIAINGRCAALLELGAGFNPEFSGRDNVFLSGMLYGFSAEEMLARYDDIVHFAGIGEHIDHPVKTYSSGMFARLAFAVSIHVDPDILLVDEILSVGDLGFRSRCHQRIEAMKDRGVSILFVTHDMGTVQTLCDEVLLLHQGEMVCMDEPTRVTERYLSLLGEKRTAAALATEKNAPVITKRLEWLDARFENEQGIQTMNPQTGSRCRAVVRVRFDDPVDRPVFNFQLKTLTGFIVYDQTSVFLGKKIPPIRAGDTLEVSWHFTLHVCPGPFRLGMGIAEEIDGIPRAIAGKEALVFEAISETRAYGVANLEADFEVVIS